MRLPRRCLRRSRVARACAGASRRCAASCESLSSLRLPNATVTSATGSPPARSRLRLRPGRGVAPALARAMAALPAFCRVALTSKPTADSDIKIEVWLPASGWNGKLQAVGNGGWAGTISYRRWPLRVAHGYATASTDSGHTTPGASFAVGHPEKARRLRAPIAARDGGACESGRRARITATRSAASIWNGCSTGGNQGLTLASMYPEDFDAIVAGAPPDIRSRVHAVRLVLHRFVHRTRRQLHSAREVPGRPQSGDGRVRCEGRRQRRHHRESSRVPFRSEGAPVQGCGRPVVPDRRAGRDRARAVLGHQASENGPGALHAAAAARIRVAVGNARRAAAVFECDRRHTSISSRKEQAWDPARFDAAVDVEKMDAAAAVLNTAGDNLKPFFARGGKLLLYHGWSDQQNPASTSVSYFARVVKTAGTERRRQIHSALHGSGHESLPGRRRHRHVRQGGGIEEWMAKGTAPAQIVASHADRRQSRSHAPFVPVSAGGGI